MAILQPDGSFTLTYQLVEGDQDVTVKAIDGATNETDLTLKLRWEQ
jgi:hypothetical protein